MGSSGTSECAGPAVLVVEDEALIRLLLADELEAAGFAVIEAENADQAIARLLQDRNIGCVLTDVRMPGSMDGLGLAAWMQAHAPTVPIIITSGGVVPEIAQLNPAIARIVAKPYRPEDAPGWVREVGRSSERSAD